MSHNIWRRWVSRLFRQNIQKRLRVRRRLALECLEDRVVPATDTWTGLGGIGATAADWSNTSNWSLGRAPIAGDDIVFNSATPIMATIDNDSLTMGSFDSITFNAPGYSISGTATIVLSGALNASANLGILPPPAAPTSPPIGEPVISSPVEFTPSTSNPQQTITVGSGTILDISGAVSGNSPTQTVFKSGTGELELDGSNTGFTGAWNLSANGGIVLITNADALGTGAAVSGDPNAGTTTVNANAQLQVSNNITVPEQLILNGPGIVNDGAILNESGNNTWSGQVQMDSNSSFGSNAGNLTFSNVISDLGAGYSLTKEGYGTITFSHVGGNTYRGQTIIDNGILAIQDPLSLGAGANSTTLQSGTTGSETIVNYNSSTLTFGTLELDYVPGTIPSTDPNAVLQNPALPYNATTNPIIGFQVFNDLLVLNGPGADPSAPNGGATGLGQTQDYLGALYNANGNNGWDGNVTLGSITSSITDPVTTYYYYNPPPFTVTKTRNDVFIGAAASSNLTISGVVSDGTATPPELDKVQQGRVILTDANTYTGETNIDQGDLEITDSNALGSSVVWVGDNYEWVRVNSISGGVSENGGAWPANDSALELGVDSGLDGTYTLTNGVLTPLRSHGRNLGFDSVTGSGQGVTGTGTGSMQEIYIPGSSGTTSTGNFTVTFNYNGTTNTTSALASTIGATGLQNALNNLTSIANAGGVTVTQDADVYRVLFNSTTNNVPLMTISTSISGAVVNPVYGLIVPNDIVDASTGVNDEGGLNSLSGINIYTGSITLGNYVDFTGLIGGITNPDSYLLVNPPVPLLTGSIGVELDARPGHATADNSYLIYDYKLTIPSLDQIESDSTVTFDKFGTGQLVIAQANEGLDGPTDIAAGWITAEASDALGPPIVFPSESELIQPDEITVGSGGSLQLLPPPGQDITLGNNFILSGLGIPATTSLVPGINFHMLTEGSILSLGGDNVLTGTIQLDGTGSIGVDDPVLSDLPSQSVLTITGEIEDYQSPLGDISGGLDKLGERELIVQGPGTYTGANTIESGTLLLQNNTGLGLDSSGTGLASNATDIYTSTTTAVATGGLLELGNTNPTTDGGIATAVQIWNENLTLNGGGQQLNISGQGGTFQLSYTNPTTGITDTTSAINVTSTTLASDIQAALNVLPNILDYGSVDVTAVNGFVGLFTVVFNGLLASVANPLLAATPGAAPGDATVTVSGSPYSVYALDDNLWAGGATLNSNSTIEVANNARLTIQGSITDSNVSALSLNTPTNTLSTASADNGELVLSGTNTYRGTTYVNAGILTVANSQALGAPGTPEEQAIGVNGTSGTFTLSFDGYTTGTLNVASPTLSSDIQTALNNLMSVGGVGGSVTVTPSLTLSNTYNVIFNGGSLVGFAQPLMTSTTLTGLPGVSVSEIQAGYGGTIVSNGAQMQVEGNLTIAGEPLELEGTGQSAGDTPTSIPFTWYEVGPAPSNNGLTAGNNAISGRVTGVVTDPSDPNVIYISTAGGGAWRTINDGLTWTPLFDGLPEIQTITVDTLGNFNLTFNGQTTTIDGSSQTLALDIQNALNALTTIDGGPSPLGGNVVVTQAGHVYTVTFGGAFAGSPENLITASGGVTTTEIQAGVSPSVAMFSGAIAIDPNNVDTIYLGTGEADNSYDSYYGTGVYVTYNYGATWSLLQGSIFNPTLSGTGNPIYGAAVSSIVVDPAHAYTIYVATSDLPSSLNEEQSIAVNGTSGTFTLTFNGWTTSMATPLDASSLTLASDIATQLNELPSIENAGGVVAVAASSTAGTYIVTFEGSFTGESEPLITASVISGTLEVSTSVIQTGYGGNNTTGNIPINDPDPDADNAGVWRYIGTGPNGTANGGGTLVANPNIGWTDLTTLVSLLRSQGDPSLTAETAILGDIYEASNFNFTLPLIDESVVTSLPAFPGPGITLLAGFPTPTNTSGPDDNFSVTFPTTGVYSDLAYGETTIPLLVFDPYINPQGYIIDTTDGIVPTLYVALGDPNNRVPGGQENAVYRLVNPFDASEATIDGYKGLSTIWDIGQGNTWLITPPAGGPQLVSVFYNFPGASITPALPGSFPLPGSYPGTDADGDEQPDSGNIKITAVGQTIYAAVTWSTSNVLLDGVPELEEVYVSTDGGYEWLGTSSQPTNYMNNQGNYDSSIVADPTNANEVFLLGDVASGTTADQVLMSTTGGASWTDISVDALGNGPHSNEHAATIDSNGNLIVGNDGGVWEYDTTTNLWIDLNGDLAITTENGVSTAPGDPQEILASSQDDNGIQLDDPALTGATPQAWVGVDQGNGGEVFYDPLNPLIAYGILDNNLQITINGGQTWTPLPVSNDMYAPFVVDSVNPNRLLLGGNGLIESENQGQTWTNLTATPIGGFNVTAVAIATYQGESGPNGTFVPDPGFSDVTDLGADTYDPGTIYITNGTIIYATLDGGINWKPRTPSKALLNGGTIESLTVDPLNRNTVFAVIQDVDGQGNSVLESTNAGQSWTNITQASIGTNNLPNVPFWTLAIDPRTNTLYLGSDIGVYSAIPNGAATTWSRFGDGLPNVQVTALDLDMTTNTLTAATFGRSVFQLSLNYQPMANTGALRIVAGSSVWTGPVRLIGATTLEADGIQNLPLGQAELNIQGIISDATFGGDYPLIKTGVGTIIFSGANTYGGTTTVEEGVLVANNLTALGTNLTQGTTVDDGASLELNADLDDVPVTLIGNGIPFNDHYTGALRNISGDNTFFGSISLEPDAADTTTIGADSGTEMNLTGQISSFDPGTGELIKEGTGTVVFDNENPAPYENDYTGTTYVYQGVLQAETSDAFSTGTVEVLDGAQVQVQTPQDIQAVTVTATTGSFMLSFDGDSTTTLLAGSATLANDIMNALNALANIGGVGGFVTVVEQTANVFTVAFGGTLFGEDVNPLTVTNLVVTKGTVTTQVVQAGGPAVNVPNNLILSGTGIFGTGALLDSGGDNTWSGNITFNVLPGFSPFTTPVGTVAIGVNDDDTLTLLGAISDQPTTGSSGSSQPGNVIPIGLLKVGAGILDMPTLNNYTGTTEVANGILDLQNPNALGDRAADYPNLNTVQQIVTEDANATKSAMFTIHYGSYTEKLRWNTANAGAVANAFDGGGGLFAQAGIVGGSVTVTKTPIDTATENDLPGVTAPVQGYIYTITFGGTATTNNTPILVTGLNGVITDASIVSAGSVDVVVDNFDGTSGELALDDSVAGSPITVSAIHTITLNGDGPTQSSTTESLVNPNGDGALFNYIGNNTWAGSIDLATASQIGVAASTTLSLSGTTTSGTGTPDDGITDTLEKIDPGSLIYTSTGSFIGETIITTGDLEADGQVGIADGVVLNGGILSGNGTVGVISSSSPLSGGGGTINPGENSPESIGTLTSTGLASPAFTPADVLNSTDTFYVDIGPYPVGDLLNVDNASIDLGGATLAGIADPSITAGQSFVLVQTDYATNPGDMVSGEFAGATTTPVLSEDSNGNPVLGATIDWIDNEKFVINYFADEVVATRELAVVTATLAPSLSSPVYGQGEQFIATLTAEQFAPPVTGKVAFTVNGPAGTSIYTVAIDPATGIASLNLLSAPLAIGTYSVTVSYNGDNSSGVLTYNPIVDQAMVPSSVTVSQAPTSISVVSSNLAPISSQNITFTATVNTQVSSPVPDTDAPTGTVAFYDGIGASQIFLGYGTLSSSGTTLTATFNTSSLPVGPHIITAVYSGDSNYLTTSSDVTLIVNEDTTTTVASASPEVAVYGQGVQLSATVTANALRSGIPTGTVTFMRILSGGTSVALGTGTLSGGVATYTTTQGQLPLATSGVNITAIYNGDGTPDDYFTSSDTIAVTVNEDATTTTLLSASPSPSVYGQPVTFTVQVGANAPGAGNPTGMVEFFLNGSTTPIGTGTLSTTDGVTTASYTTSAFQLPVGTANITAQYLGDTDFNGSTTATGLSQTVNRDGTTTTVNSSAEPGGAVFGQQVTFTAVVAPAAPESGTPTGTVTFTDTTTGQILGMGSLVIVNGVDKATYTTTTNQLTLGTGQTITATYSGDINFSGSSGTMSQDVNADESTVRVSSSAPIGSVFGQQVTFTATVSAIAPGTTTPTGTVTFMDGSTVLASNVPLNSGVATYTTTASQLTLGSNTISVTYGGDMNFIGSTGNVTQVVNQDSTNTTVSSSGSSVYGNPVTFTATVSANSPGAGNPTGTVTFFVTENDILVELGTGNLSSSTGNTSTATYTTTDTQLLVGSNQTITASYSGDTNFLTSLGTTVQAVSRGLVTVAVSSTWSTAPSNDLYGQPVTFTATVTPNVGTINPTGTVTFAEGSTVLASNVALNLVNGVETATFTTAQLPTGLNQTITAGYSGDSNYELAAESELQSVYPDPTTTTLSSSSGTVNVGQVVAFTATVSEQNSGNGVPTGVVSFLNTTTNAILGSTSLVNGVATFATSFSSKGAPAIEAIYNGNADYVTSTSDPITETVLAVGTRSSKVTVTSSLNPSQLGDSVTFTATVKDTGSGTVHTPAGIVSFLDGTTLLGTGTLSTVKGVTTTTLTTSSLPLGNNSITVVYAGNSTFAKAASAAIIETVNPIPIRTSTTTLISSSALSSGTYSSPYGQTVKFTATVTDTGGTPTVTPGGTMTFAYTISGSSTVHVLGTETVSGSGATGTATFSTSTLAEGSYTIIASYNGNLVFAAGSPATIAQDITQISATTVLKSSAANDTSVFGQAVTFTATVTKSTGGAPAGTVVFKDQTTGAVLGTVALNSSGVATVKTSTLAVGSHNIIATYNGNVNVAESSQTLTQTVNQDNVTMSLAASTASSNVPVTFTVTVLAASPGAGTPTGTVTFYLDGAYLATISLSTTHKATLTLSGGVATGEHTIEAVYSGDDNFLSNNRTTAINFVVGRGT